jgi:hypothetical protein
MNLKSNLLIKENIEMTQQYYELSTDYGLAERFLKEGATLAAWLTIDGHKDLYIISFQNGLIKLQGHSMQHSFDYEKYLVQFILPIPDPTYDLKTDLAEVQQQCSRLQHSLTQALNEADELRRELTVANASISELEAQNELAIEALTDVARQLGFESFVYEDVMSAIADLYTQIEGREAALRGSGKLHKERKEVASKLEDNLTRANSDRLSELTSIMRMVQALEDVPQEEQQGAIYLIKRVIYDAICRLDPSQSWDA